MFLNVGVDIYAPLTLLYFNTLGIYIPRRESWTIFLNKQELVQHKLEVSKLLLANGVVADSCPPNNQSDKVVSSGSSGL